MVGAVRLRGHGRNAMSRTMIGAALAVAFAAEAAFAADFYRPAPYVAPYGLPVWSGFYVGLNAGYQWGSVTNSAFSPSGFAGGAQAGYNWQSGSFVFGGETDLQLSGAN